LFGEPPDEEIGRAGDLGWFGLITSGSGDGGTIISQDEQGFRYVWKTEDGTALDARWQAILGEYRTYDDAVLKLERWAQASRQKRVGYACPECEEPIVERVQALGRVAWTHRDGESLCPVMGSEGYEPTKPGVWRYGEIIPLAGEPDGDDADGDGPRIYVASLSDYNEGTLHGRWLAADHEPEDLQAAIDRMLASSPAREYGEAAEEYAIHDYDGFGGDLASVMGEWPSLKDVSTVAKGLAEHGPAYGAWVAYVGRVDDELVEQFQDRFMGEWESVTEYAKHVLEETEFYRFLDHIPEEMRIYINVDVEQYAEDLTCEMYVAESPGGGVWVFDVR
jgi:antirestriction protein